MNDPNNITELSAIPMKMPVLFLGHGNPMNAIEENEFVTGWRNIVKMFPKPAAILCISAHWETRGTFVTAMEKPRTIHDFGGFPEALYAVQYPAPGSPQLANDTKEIITKTNIGLDDKWGLDHGCWSVVKHLFPKADIPVIEMSLDYEQTPQFHYDLAKELALLRKKGILIIGSGNMVHNLQMVSWENLNTEFGYDWAIEANERMKRFIIEGNHKALINYQSLGKVFDQAIPTPDHFLPLLYTLALKEDNESVSLFNDKLVGGSLSMTSFIIDKS
jgi:4,5-DOPA dioxygenase extradiol